MRKSKLPESGLTRAAAAAGSLAALARLIGRRQSTLWTWAVSGKPPAEVCGQIEAAVGGIVTRHDLRPDLFGEPPAKPGKRSGKSSLAEAA